MSRKKTHKQLFPEFASNILNVIEHLYPGDKNNKKLFAKEISVHYDTVRRWCNGVNLPDGADLLTIRSKFHISIDWLLTGKGFEKAYQAVNETPEKYMANWKDETIDACRDVKEILESDDEVAAFALRSNIAAFRDSVRRKEDNKRHQDEISTLQKRLRHLEKIHETNPDTGTAKAAGTGSPRKKT